MIFYGSMAWMNNMVEEEGMETDEDLEQWIQRGLTFTRTLLKK